MIAHGICLIAYSVLSSGTAIAYSDSQSQREYQIKAAFLYNFTKFVEWPTDRFANESASIILCVIGMDPFGATLEDTVAGKAVKGRPIDIGRIDTVDELDACHLIFVGLSEPDRLRQIVAISHAANALTVGDIEDFIEYGGVIGLIKRANKIQFEINLISAKQARLKLDLRLLRLANSVKK